METTSDRAEAILNEAIEIVGETERLAFVERACDGNLELQSLVLRLIDCHFRAGSFLSPPTVGINPSAGEQPGETIGQYKLLEKIGEGGFGVVFMAEQKHPIRRVVALKILKPGMDTAQVLARFEAERQALALMEHPNIARVLDGGATASGRPYFVMELVKGVPITNYCDEHQLTNRARLALFVSVCDAVQHAHQKGIIHRDIKPANVLVAAYDGRPVPKVIDFGVAKAMGHTLTERTLVTKFAEIIGTLEYMSPEQAEFNAIDVDTRSDIYGLGVLLYVLLTGTTPLTHQRIKRAALTDVLRLIREEEPPTPSTRLSESRDSLASISAQRQLDPARLTREVRGELDWIAMKCLEKQRSRRYETASALARDVQRYLGDEPVEACPPSAWYMLSKIARRHRRVLAAAGVFLLLLISGIIALGIAYAAVNRERQDKELALKAESERRRQTRAALDAMSSQIVEDWLSRQPELLPEHRRFLEQALSFYEEFAEVTGNGQESRAAGADAFARVAGIYDVLGERTKSESAWNRARELYNALAVDFPENPEYRIGLAKVWLRLAAVFRETGRTTEAESAANQGAAIHRKLVKEFPESVEYQHRLAAALTRVGMLHKDLGKLDEAEKDYREAINIHQKLLAVSSDDPTRRDELGQALINLGSLQDIRDKDEEATSLVRQAATLFEQLAGEHANNCYYLDMQARCLNNLGNVLREDEKLREAEQTFQKALQIRRKLAAEFPSVPDFAQGLAMSLNNLGILFKDTERLDDAEEMYRQATVIHRRLAADFPQIADHQNEVGGAIVNLARLLLIRQRFDEARNLLVDGEPHHRAALSASPDNPVYRKFYRLNRWRLADACIGMADHIAAAEAAQQFLDCAFEPPRDAYTTAALFAACVRLAEQDGRLDEVQRRELVGRYGDRAVAALRRAIELKAAEITGIPSDPALDPIRSRDDFQHLSPGSDK